MRFGNVGRAFLLGTSALAMAASPAVSASFDILVNTTANETLNTGETGRVRSGATLTGSVFGLPTVDIVGSGASLDIENGGAINGLNFAGGGVSVRGPIMGVSIDNSGTISNFGGGISISTGADLSGGLLNQASGTVSGGSFAIAVGVFGSSDISGLLDNSGTLTGGSGVGVLTMSGIAGGVINRTGGTIFGRGTGVFTFDHSDIQGGIENEAMATIQGFTFGVLSSRTSNISGGIDNSGTITGLTAAIAARTNNGTISGGMFGIRVTSNSDISGGVNNSGTLSGGTYGIRILNNSSITGGIDNHGMIKGTGGTSFGISVLGAGSDINFANNAGLGAGIVNRANASISGSDAGIVVPGGADISGGVTNEAMGTISGATAGIFVAATSSQISGGIVNAGTIKGTAGSAILDGDKALAVTNSGTLEGTGGLAANLRGGDDNLTLQGMNTSNLVGDADGGAGVDALTLKGTGAEDENFVNFESLEMDGVDWMLDGDAVLLGTGVATVTAGRLQVGGTLTAPGSVLLKTDAALTVKDTGRIDGAATAVLASGITTVAGNVDNSGTIIGTNIGIGVLSTSDISGGLFSRTGGTINGGSVGIEVGAMSDIGGGILNESGATISAFTNSIFVAGGANISGGIDNNGAISGTGLAGIGVRVSGAGSDLSGGLDNRSFVTGVAAAVSVDAGATMTGRVLNQAAATISGGATGFAVAGGAAISGGVDNHGTIRGTNTASSFGIRVSGAGSDINFANNAGLGAGIVNRANGIIVGDRAGINVESAADISGGVVNQVGGNTLVLNGMGSGALNTVTQAAAEEGFSFQRAVAGESRIRPIGPDTRLWARGMADFIDRDGDRRNAGYQQDITGVAFGGDTGSFGEGLRLGLAGGYLGSDVSASDGTGNSADIYSLQALAYGTYDLASLGEGTQLFFGVQGGHQSQDIERSVVVAGAPTKAKGDTSGYLFGGYLGLSREFPIDDNWMVRPSGGVRYLHQSQESYRDSQGMSVEDLSFDTLRTGPQVEMLGQFENVGGVTFQPRGQVGWTRQVALDDRQVRLSLPSGTSGNVDLEDGNESYITVGIGLDVIFQPGLRAFVGFDGAYGDEQSRSSAFAGVSIDLP